MRFLTVLGVSLLLLGAGGQALAEDVDPVGGWLEWLPGDTCPTADAFTAKVAEHLGGAPAAAAQQAQVRIRARLQRHDGEGPRWRAEAQLLNSAGTVVGTRTISNDSDTCAPVSDALALVSALLLANPPPPVSLPEASAPPPATPVAVSSPEPGWSAGVGAGPSVSAGMLPGVGLAGELRLFVAPPVGPGFYAGFAFWPQSSATVADQQGADIGAWIAALGVCPLTWSSGSRQLDLCAGGELGRMHASGFGFVTSSSRNRWIFDLAAGGQGRQKIVGGLFVELGVRAVVPLLRNRVAYAGADGTSQKVFEMASVAAVGHLGLGFAFP